MRNIPLVYTLPIVLAIEITPVSESSALAQPDGGLGLETSTPRDRSVSDLQAGGDVLCVSPFYPDSTPAARKINKHRIYRVNYTLSYLTECQKCPDSWSRCEPCEPDSVIRATLSALEDVHKKHVMRMACPAKTVDVLRTLTLPRHPRRDEVWARIADLYYFDCAMPTLAAEIYRRLIRDDADTTIKAHAALALGEILFLSGELVDAEKDFEMAAKFTSGEQALCCAYRQAWVLAKLGHTDLARKRLYSCAHTNLSDPFSAILRTICATDERRLNP